MGEEEDKIQDDDDSNNDDLSIQKVLEQYLPKEDDEEATIDTVCKKE